MYMYMYMYMYMKMISDWHEREGCGPLVVVQELKDNGNKFKCLEPVMTKDGGFVVLRPVRVWPRVVLNSYR